MREKQYEAKPLFTDAWDRKKNEEAFGQWHIWEVAEKEGLGWFSQVVLLSTEQQRGLKPPWESKNKTKCTAANASLLTREMHALVFFWLAHNNK